MSDILSPKRGKSRVALVVLTTSRYGFEHARSTYGYKTDKYLFTHAYDIIYLTYVDAQLMYQSAINVKLQQPPSLYFGPNNFAIAKVDAPSHQPAKTLSTICMETRRAWNLHQLARIA